MSLVVSRKENNYMVIVGDTKLSPLTGEVNNKYTGNPLDGVIKAVIIGPNLCVCFAGDIAPAEEAYKEIGSSQETERALEIIKRKSSTGETEFLACTANPLRIFKASKGNVSEEENSWIGSANAFARYQGYFLGELEPPQVSPTMMAVEPTSIKSNSALTNVASSLDHVIADPQVPDVDGFRVMVHWLNNSFQYKSYIRSYQGIIAINAASFKGKKIIPMGLGSAADGSYNINFFGSDNAFTHAAIHVRDGKLGIVYSRKDLGLMRPEVYKMDEVDFVDLVREQYGFGPAMTSQDREHKFFEQGNGLFNEAQYLDAISSYEKAIAENKKLKGQSMYRKGLALMNLKRIPEGLIEINKAISADPSLFQEGMKLLQKVFKKRNK